MKYFVTFIAFVLMLAAGSTVYASQIYDFSYTFQDLTVISGSFTGDANGNLITNLSNIYANFGGLAFVGSGSLYNAGYISPFGWTAGAGVVSFDGTQNNFIFTETDWLMGGGGFMNDFCSIGNYAENLNYYVGSYHIDGGTNYSPARWSVTAESVPEPSVMLLFGSGLAGMAAMRRRFKK